MEKLRKKFGKRVRELRINLNLTQEELAANSNISVDFISLIERGINAPSFETLEALARALHVEVNILFTFDKGDSKND